MVALPCARFDCVVYLKLLGCGMLWVGIVGFVVCLFGVKLVDCVFVLLLWGVVYLQITCVLCFGYDVGV